MSNMTSVCPFAKTASGDGGCPMKFDQNCDRHKAGDEDKVDKQTNYSSIVSPKCPFGYDSHTFKLGPLSCMICQALLYESSKCVPCSHKFCKTCISRFRDCPLCGADIENIEPDADLQATVDRFIDGHARIKRSQAFRAKNIESAKSRLTLCAEDIREQLQMSGDTPELCSQLGAVLGMLGDCCRAMGNTGSAVTYYEESVEFLSKMPVEDLEVVHTLSVSLNKVGDLKYYDGDLQSARSYYTRALDVRRNAVKEHANSTSEVLDLAVSLAKVADLDRNLGNKDGAISGFLEAIEHLESLKLDSGETSLEQRRHSVLEFLHNQLAEKQEPAPATTV